MNETAKHAAERRDQHAIVDLLRDERSEHLRVRGRLGERQVSTEGIDEAGVTRLPALDARGIAAATVTAASARIGDARSTYEDGIVSRVNHRAAALGAAPGIGARDFVAIVRGGPAAREEKR